MQREIAITELKPVLAAQRSHRAHEAPAHGFTAPALRGIGLAGQRIRSEEHTSELPSLMRISYAVFCLKTNTNHPTPTHHPTPPPLPHPPPPTPPHHTPP